MSKYGAIITWIKEKIESGEFRGGDRLPSENELSELFGYSRQTVRHALAELEKEGISESRHGSGNYIRNRAHLADLNGFAGKNIKIITTYVNGYIFPRVLDGISRTLVKNGCSIRMSFTYNHIEDERKALLEVLSEPIDGVIAEPVMSAIPNPNRALYEKIREKGIPVIFFHSYYPDLDIPHVSMDDVEAGKAAAEYLIGLGHEKIAGIFKSDDGQGHRRYEGYTKALRAHGIPIRESRVIWIDTEEERNLTYSRDKILKRIKGCTAFVCYNDELAHELTLLFREAGISVPKDLSIASIDNSELGKLNSVPLTSASHPMEKLGEKVVENLLCMMKDPDFDGTYEFTPKMKVRESAVRCTEKE